MKKLILILSFSLLPLLSKANLELCGVEQENTHVKAFTSCHQKSGTLSPRKEYECYLEVYENAMSELKTASIAKQSPELRSFLSITRANFQTGDQAKRLLNYYETTELYRLSSECKQDQQVSFFEETLNGEHSLSIRECLISGDKLDQALEVAKKSQSAHYAMFNAGRKLNQLKNLLSPPSRRNFRDEPEPKAFRDCREGIAPGAYPPLKYLAKQRDKDKSKDDLGCPSWVQDNIGCDTQRSTLVEMSEDLLAHELFNLGVATQLSAFAEQLLTKNPKSLTTNYKAKVVKKIEASLSKCFENNDLDKEQALQDFKLTLLDDGYFDQEGYDRYEEMEAEQTAKAIKRLGSLEKYYAKIANKYAVLNQYYLGKCQHSHFFPSWGVSQSEECQEINTQINKFKDSFVNPISQEISQIRQQLPFLSIPLSGGEFGSSTCFTGIVDDMATRPLSYMIYGKFTPLVKAQEFKQRSKELHYDMSCGTPLWKGAIDSEKFSFSFDQNALGLDTNINYQNLLKITHPSWSERGVYPDKSTLDNIIENELDPNNESSELKMFELFMESYHRQPPPTGAEIKLAKKIKSEADRGIEDALTNTLEDACDNPQDYGRELLANDAIGKLMFEKNNFSTASKSIYCQTRNSFLNEEANRDRNLMDASIGIGMVGFIHPVAALAVLPIEFGLEYAQYAEMSSDKRRNLSLALLGLEDYQKAEEEIDSLKSEELMFYGIISAMALGGVGDVVDGLSGIAKSTRSQSRIARNLEATIENFSDAGKTTARDFGRKIQTINSSGMSELDKRLRIIEAYRELERTLPESEFLAISKVFGEQVQSIKKLLAQDIKFDLAKTFAREDLSSFIDDIAQIERMEDIETLLKAYSKAKSSPEEMQAFLHLMKRRKLSCSI